MDVIKQLTKEKLDLLKELGNIGAGNSATALSKILNNKIEMNIPNVKIVSFDELVHTFGGPESVGVSIFFRFEGDVSGSIFYVMSLDQAENFARKLTKDLTFSLRTPPYRELGVSSLKELGNILISTYLSSLSDFTNLKLYPSVPSISIDMFGATISYGLIELSKISDYAITINAEIASVDEHFNQESLKGYFFLLPDPDLFQLLFNALGVNDER